MQRQITLSVPGPLRVVVYRRMMFRIAERIARDVDAQALVTGEVVGQVASQTLENIAGDFRGHQPARVPPADRHGQGRDHGRGSSGLAPIPSPSFQTRTAARCSRRVIR